MIKFEFGQHCHFNNLACFDFHTIDDYKDRSYPVISDLYKTGWKIIFLTNENNKTEYNLKKKYFEFYEKCNEIPMTFIASNNNDKFNKPCTAMWNEVIKNNDTICMRFHCGKSFKSSNMNDIYFAMNVDIPFIRPDDLFSNKNLELQRLLAYSIQYVHPFSLAVSDLNKSVDKFCSNYKYICIVGPRMCGKTYFCKKYLSKYIRISRGDFVDYHSYKHYIQCNLDKHIVFDDTNYTLKEQNDILEIINEKIPNFTLGYIVKHSSIKECLYWNNYNVENGGTHVDELDIRPYFVKLHMPKTNSFLIDNWFQNLPKFYS